MEGSSQGHEWMSIGISGQQALFKVSRSIARRLCSQPGDESGIDAGESEFVGKQVRLIQLPPNAGV
jgi:hypothetical protein